MNKTEYIWKNGNLIPWEDAVTHVLSHSLHYGSAVFEGIRFYETNNGPAVFKLQEHIDRLFYSAKQLAMNIPYSREEVIQAVLETLRKNKITSGYIRPLVYYGEGTVKIIPSKNLPVEVVIACWPWGKYIDVPALDVTISPYIRIHPKSTITDAKISGHYVNSILSGLALQNTKYHEALLLDVDGNVAEGSAENIFIVKQGRLITTPVETILPGITRAVVIEIAKQLKLPVVQQYFTPEDVIQADEAFFCGTAVEIIPIRSLDDKLIADGEIGEITNIIKSEYYQITHGENELFQQSLSLVNVGIYTH